MNKSTIIVAGLMTVALTVWTVAQIRPVTPANPSPGLYGTNVGPGFANGGTGFTTNVGPGLNPKNPPGFINHVPGEAGVSPQN